MFNEITPTNSLQAATRIKQILKERGVEDVRASDIKEALAITLGFTSSNHLDLARKESSDYVSSSLSNKKNAMLLALSNVIKECPLVDSYWVFEARDLYIFFSCHLEETVERAKKLVDASNCDIAAHSYLNNLYVESFPKSKMLFESFDDGTCLPIFNNSMEKGRLPAYCDGDGCRDLLNVIIFIVACRDYNFRKFNPLSDRFNWNSQQTHELFGLLYNSKSFNELFEIALQALKSRLDESLNNHPSIYRAGIVGLSSESIRMRIHKRLLEYHMAAYKRIMKHISLS